MVTAKANQPIFKFLGGWLCLNFVDTKNWDTGEPKYERFKSYTDLVWWNYQVGAFTESETEHLLQEAERRPADAALVFEQSMTLRNTVYEVFAALAVGLPPEEVNLVALNKTLSQTLAQSHIAPAADGFTWTWAGVDNALERVMWSIAWSAAELLISDQLDRLKKCAGDSCGWLFLDTSRNRSRRWCQMEHCGNLAKARRHYKRKRVAK